MYVCMYVCMYHEAITWLKYNQLVTKLHMIIIYYVTWLYQLTQIFVPGFTDKFVCIGILWVHRRYCVIVPCRSNRSNFFTTMGFSKVKSMLRMYADGFCAKSSGILHWREYLGYCGSISTLNRTQPKLIWNLNQKGYPFQTASERINGTAELHSQ